MCIELIVGSRLFLDVYYLLALSGKWSVLVVGIVACVFGKGRFAYEIGRELALAEFLLLSSGLNFCHASFIIEI